MSEIHLFPPESEAIRALRSQLSDAHYTKDKQSKSVIKDPQSEAVRQILQRLSLGQN